MLAPHVRPRLLRDPRVDDVSGHDRGGVRPAAREGLRPASPAPTSPSATARSGSTRATRRGTSATPRRSSPGSTPRRSTSSTPSTARSSTRPCRSPGVKEAELAKLLENTFRHVNIALVNELAMFAHELGIDVWDGHRRGGDQAVRLHEVHARARRRRALPADRPVVPVVAGAPGARARSFRFVELANDVNEHMPDYVVRRVAAKLNARAQGASTGRRVLVLGLAYKKNSGDARESPAVARRRAARRRSAPTSRAADPLVATALRARRRHAGRRSTTTQLAAADVVRRAHRPRRLRLGRGRRASPTRCSTPATGLPAPAPRSSDARRQADRDES